MCNIVSWLEFALWLWELKLVLCDDLERWGGWEVRERDSRGRFSSVQLLSHVRLFATAWTAAHQASLSSPTPGACSNSCLLSQWCHPTTVIPFSSFLQSFPASGSFPVSQFFPSGGQSIGSISFSINPSNEYSGLISFRMDWFDLLAIQGSPKRLLQHYSSEASILQRSAFFIVQLSCPYMSTEKTIALTRWTFVSKVMSLLFNMLSRLVIAFLTRSKHLLISWLQSWSVVILEPKKIKAVTVSIVSPSIYHEVVGLDAMTLIFWILTFESASSLSSFTFIKREGTYVYL